MRGQPCQDIFEHFIRESRSGMPDVAQLALVVGAEHQAAKCFRDPEGLVMPPITASCCMRDLILSQDLERRPG